MPLNAFLEISLNNLLKITFFVNFHKFNKKLKMFFFSTHLDVSTTDAIKATTEIIDLSTSTKPSEQNDDEEILTTIGQTVKVINAVSATTTQSSVAKDASTTISYDEDNDGSMVASKTEASVESASDETMESSSESDEHETVNDVTNGPAVTTEVVTESTEHPIKSDTIEISSTSTSIIKSNDRSRIVSKDDIESIRGRALNLSSTERKSSTSGVIYVTAPPTPAPAISKSAKSSFSDDLSDVSMDNESMDFHSSEHVATTAQPSLMHNTECHSKVRQTFIFIVFVILIRNYFSVEKPQRAFFVQGSFN